jgi:hypothetical protein
MATPFWSGFLLETIKFTKYMKTFYLTADKVGDFIARMWQAGIEASIEPKSNQITIKGADGKYLWMHVFDMCSYEDLCNAFIPKDEDNLEA